MSAARFSGLFCEDIREESLGTYSIIGVFPDTVNIQNVPSIVPKLAFYGRIVVEPDTILNPISLVLIMANGDEVPVTTLEAELLERAKQEARASDAGIGTVVSKAVIAQFLVPKYGRVKAIARMEGEGDVVCAAINFQQVPTASSEPAPLSAQSPSSPKKKGS